MTTAELAAALAVVTTGSDLVRVHDAAVRVLWQGAETAPDDPHTREALATAAAAAGDLWALARAGSRELALPLAGNLVRIAGPAALDRSPRCWLDDFWLALLADDPHALAALCYTRGDPGDTSYPAQLAEAMRRYWLRDPTAAKPLLAALRATDPAHLPPDEVDRALDIDVPVIEVAFALFDANATELDAAFTKAFELHPGGFAVALAALRAHATRIGIPVTAASQAAPSALRGDHGDRELLLCPYCLAPIMKGMRVCPACLEDPTNDAAIATSLADFLASPRKRCGSCATAIPKLAVRCPSCRNAPG